jgi:transposase
MPDHCGGMHRTSLRGRENVHKRYLIHVAGHDLGLLMRLLIGTGTPKEAAVRGRALLVIVRTENTLSIIIYGFDQTGLGVLVIAATTAPT